MGIVTNFPKTCHHRWLRMIYIMVFTSVCILVSCSKMTLKNGKGKKDVKIVTFK